MTQQLIITTPANSGQGDSPKSAFDKINANFSDLYNGTSGMVYTPPGAGAAPTTVAGKLSQVVSAFDFLTPAQQAAVSGNLATIDVTTQLQAAATYVGSVGGGTLYLPAGTYMINQTVKLSSNTILQGVGTATVILANPVYVGTNSGSYATQNCHLIGNVNFGATQLTDHDIGVRDVNFNWGNVTIAGGGAHSISFHFVSRVTIYNVYQIQAGTGHNGENVTSFISCLDTSTLFCHGKNCTNAYFDDWGGTGSAHVISCTGRTNDGFAYWDQTVSYVIGNVVVSGGVFYTAAANNTNSKPPNANWTTGGAAVTTSQGIQFTGQGSYGDSGAAQNAVVAFCELYGIQNSGTASAIIHNSNGAASSTARFKSFGNYVESCDLGWVSQGSLGQAQSHGDTFRKCTTGAPIFFNSDGSGSPSNCKIVNPTLIDCSHTSGNIGMIVVIGTNNRVEGVNVFSPSGVLYTYIAWLPSTAVNCLIGIDKAPNGITSARVDNQSSSSIVKDVDDLDGWPYNGALPVISAAATIAPNLGTTFVNGSTNVANITVPNGCQQGGTIQLIPTGGSTWNTVATGNIQTATTVIAGRVLQMTYIANLGKWYPSYV